MRGKVQAQQELVTIISLESFVPKDHPLRPIKLRLDHVLKLLSSTFDQMYAEEGRPSIPPERLLKAKVLIALYSVRSERLFCEMLQYNLLFRWFLDLEMSEGTWDATTFSKNQERLLEHHVAASFFSTVVELAKQEGWASQDHFTVDGTLIEAWASLKSFTRKGEKPKTDDPDKGNPTIDFHKEKRSNATHQSTTDPEARLAKKSKGKEARLSFGAHALMENRSGLCMDLRIEDAGAKTEGEVALELLQDHRNIHQATPRTVGADKGYHNKDFVQGCREKGIKPHVAPMEKRQVEGLDNRTLKSKGFETSSRIRKRIEEIFGWIKTVGAFRKTRYRGRERTQMSAYFVAGAYNLLRMANLSRQVSPG
jgi:transposase/IS5 family transposase